jgi:hypothetical protein
LLKVKLGNFPKHSKAYLRAYCSQILEIEDQSYYFRLPMAFVPSYIDHNYIDGKKKGVKIKG